MDKNESLTNDVPPTYNSDVFISSGYKFFVRILSQTNKRIAGGHRL